jgi:hypothetical protein
MKVRRSLCLVGGAAGMYFLDPVSGRRRRSVARDKLKSRAAIGRRRRERREAYEAGRRRGEIMRRAGAGTFHQRDDTSVAAHLHETLEHIEVPTGDVNVEVVDDVVRVRGQVRTRDEIDSVVSAVRAEAGGRHVESLLHLPAEPAPNKAASRQA